MTHEDFRRRDQIVSEMLRTAKENGKEFTFTEMMDFAKRLHRLEATLSRLAEDECCYPNYDSKKQERIENLAEKLITETIGCKCYTQRDPRGYCIRMYLNGWHNSWDGETTGLAW